MKNGSVLGVAGESAKAIFSSNDRRCICVGCKVHDVLTKLQGR